MPEVTGCSAAVSGRVWDSLHLLVDAGVDLQLRTTLWRDSIISQHLPELQHLVSEQGSTGDQHGRRRRQPISAGVMSTDIRGGKGGGRVDLDAVGSREERGMPWRERRRRIEASGAAQGCLLEPKTRRNVGRF